MGVGTPAPAPFGVGAIFFGLLSLATQAGRGGLASLGGGGSRRLALASLASASLRSAGCALPASVPPLPSIWVGQLRYLHLRKSWCCSAAERTPYALSLNWRGRRRAASTDRTITAGVAYPYYAYTSRRFLQNPTYSCIGCLIIILYSYVILTYKSRGCPRFGQHL